MLELTGSVQFKDGAVVEFTTGTAALAEWELYALRHGYPIGTAAPPMLMALVVAWTATANGSGEGFDTWRARVAGVQMDADSLDPSPPGVSAE